MSFRYIKTKYTLSFIIEKNNYGITMRPPSGFKRGTIIIKVMPTTRATSNALFYPAALKAMKR